MKERESEEVGEGERKKATERARGLERERVRERETESWFISTINNLNYCSVVISAAF